MEVTGHRLDGLVEQTMRHGGIKKRANYATMNHIIVPLQVVSCYKIGAHFPVFVGGELQPPGVWMQSSAQKAVFMPGYRFHLQDGAFGE